MNATGEQMISGLSNDAIPVVDEVALWDRFEGDSELLAEVIALFQADCPTRLSDIQAALDAPDASRLAQAAHALKGAIGNFCAAPCYDAARQLEEWARAGDLRAALSTYATLQQVLHRLQAELIRLASPSASRHEEAH